MEDHQMKTTSISPLPQLNVSPPLPQNPSALPIISIGAGAIASLGHLPAYKLAGFNIQGIYDIDRQKAIDVAKQFNIPNVYNTLDEACGTSPDGNVIFDLAIPSIQIIPTLEKMPRNSHALIQKPMGENLAEAQAIVDVCKQRNIRGSVNFQLRYAPYILALKDAIRRGWLGDRIVTVEIHINDHMPWPSWPFLATAKRLELTYHSIHYVDLVRDLLAPYEPSALHCRTSRHAVMPELTPVRSSYSFEYKDDPMLFVNIYANHHHHWGLKHASSYVLVEGTEGAAKAQIGDNLLCGKDADGKLDYLHICSDKMTNGEWVDIDLQGRRRFPHAFIGPMAAAIRRYENENDQPSTDVENALKTMAILETAWKSSMNNMTPIEYP